MRGKLFKVIIFEADQKMCGGTWKKNWLTPPDTKLGKENRNGQLIVIFFFYQSAQTICVQAIQRTSAKYAI